MRVAHTQQASLRAARRDALSRSPHWTGLDSASTVGDASRGPDPSAAGIPLRLQFIPPAPGVTKAAVPAGIGPANLRITGARNDLDVLSVNDADAGTHQLVARLARRDVGDVNAPLPGRADLAYTVELRDVPGIDPYFTRAAFTLGMPGRASRDCLDDVGDEDEPASQVTVDYLAKDYASFRRLMLDRMALSHPGWRERAAPDLGVAMVEVLAYVADYLSYYQDALATEAYLETARLRPSVRRHVRLVDYHLHEGCNARTWARIAVATDTVVPARARLLTGRGDAVIVPPGPDARALESSSRVFETMRDERLFAAHNEMAVYTWGAETYVLRQGATRATLKGRLSHLRQGDVLVVEELIGLVADRPALPFPSHRQAVRLSAPPRPGRDDLFDEPITEIEWHQDDALTRAVAICGLFRGGRLENLSVFRGNVVLVDHGRTLTEIDLPIVPPDRPYRPRLEHKGLTYRNPRDPRDDPHGSAGAALRQDPRHALPAIELIEIDTDGHVGGAAADAARADAAAADAAVGLTGTPGADSGAWRRRPARVWTPRRDLLQAGPFDRAFVVEMDGDDVATLRFGDGRLGRRPAPGTRFVARYRLGTGPFANIGPDTLGRIVSTDTRIDDVRNLLPAAGGTARETTRSAKLLAPDAFQSQHRCVTSDDYVQLAKAFPGVRNVAVQRRWTGSWLTDVLHVQRDGASPVDEGFLEALRAYLEPYRLMGRDLELRPPVYVPVDVAIDVVVTPAAHADRVRRAVDVALTGRAGEAPLHVGQATFGEPLFLSRIVAAAMRVPDVVSVQPVRFVAQTPQPQDGLARGVLTMAANEIAQAKHDHDRPEGGRLEIRVVGGR